MPACLHMAFPCWDRRKHDGLPAWPRPERSEYPGSLSITPAASNASNAQLKLWYFTSFPVKVLLLSESLVHTSSRSAIAKSARIAPVASWAFETDEGLGVLGWYLNRSTSAFAPSLTAKYSSDIQRALSLIACLSAIGKIEASKGFMPVSKWHRITVYAIADYQSTSLCVDFLRWFHGYEHLPTQIFVNSLKA